MSKVTYVGHYGDDQTIALAAWTSTSRELTLNKVNRIPQMISDLFTQGHKTPFERGIIHVLVETDIASHIHIIKHRTIGTNGESARYKELKEDKVYIPEDWNSEWQNKLIAHSQIGNDLYHQALEELTPILGRKRAKESARYFKGYNSIITTDVIMNMSAFANFYKLRHSDKAQKEISDIASEIMEVCRNIEGNPFKTTLELISNQ